MKRYCRQANLKEVLFFNHLIFLLFHLVWDGVDFLFFGLLEHLQQIFILECLDILLKLFKKDLFEKSLLT